MLQGRSKQKPAAHTYGQRFLKAQKLLVSQTAALCKACLDHPVTTLGEAGTTGAQCVNERKVDVQIWEAPPTADRSSHRPPAVKPSCQGPGQHCGPGRGALESSPLLGGSHITASHHRAAKGQKNRISSAARAWNKLGNLSQLVSSFVTLHPRAVGVACGDPV